MQAEPAADTLRDPGRGWRGICELLVDGETQKPMCWLRPFIFSGCEQADRVMTLMFMRLGSTSRLLLCHGLRIHITKAHESLELSYSDHISRFEHRFVGPGRGHERCSLARRRRRPDTGCVPGAWVENAGMVKCRIRSDALHLFQQVCGIGKPGIVCTMSFRIRYSLPCFSKENTACLLPRGGSLFCTCAPCQDVTLCAHRASFDGC